MRHPYDSKTLYDYIIYKYVSGDHKFDRDRAIEVYLDIRREEERNRDKQEGSNLIPASL